MACEGYNKTALMGNWYEERVAIPQPFREDKDFRSLRPEEDSISYITQTNLLKPLGRVGRTHTWNTQSVIVDDGFREFKTQNKTVYDPTLLSNYKNYKDCRPLVKTVEQKKTYPENHACIQTNQAKTFTMLNQPNMQKNANEIKRDVKMNITDFGSTFRKHDVEHQRFHMLTTYQQGFDRYQNPTVQEVIAKEGQKLGTFAGGKAKPDNSQGIKMTSPLVGEVFKTQKDPQQNTLIQRSWLPYVENALSTADDNMRKSTEANLSNGFKSTDKLMNYKANNSQRLPYDIATSLPVGEGEHALKSNYNETGAYRRIRSDVTMIRNKPITKK